jgi:hypothetical protein
MCELSKNELSVEDHISLGSSPDAWGSRDECLDASGEKRPNEMPWLGAQVWQTLSGAVLRIQRYNQYGSSTDEYRPFRVLSV